MIFLICSFWKASPRWLAVSARRVWTTWKGSALDLEDNKFRPRTFP